MKRNEIVVGAEYAVSRRGGAWARDSALLGRVVAEGTVPSYYGNTGKPRTGWVVELLEGHAAGTQITIPSQNIFHDAATEFRLRAEREAKQAAHEAKHREAESLAQILRGRVYQTGKSYAVSLTLSEARAVVEQLDSAAMALAELEAAVKRQATP